MRWKAKVRKEVKIGDTRIKNGFLLFPKCINGEWRWLEETTWVQEAYLGTGGGPEGPWYDVIRWRSVSWGWEVGMPLDAKYGPREPKVP